MTPKEFEEKVAELLKQKGQGLVGLNVRHREKLHDQRLPDGSPFEIDVTARFEAFGGEFLVLIECKHWNHSVGRNIVSELVQKRIGLGAQKAMLFATADFEKGAVELAVAEKVTLVRMVDGVPLYHTRSAEPPPGIPTGTQFWVYGLSDGKLSMRNVEGYPELLSKAIRNEEGCS